jgi:hypothetical protein
MIKIARQNRRHAAEYIGQQLNYASLKAGQHRLSGTLGEISGWVSNKEWET